MIGKPMAISIEPTTACNLRCPECPSGLRAFSRPVGSMGLGYYVQMIETLQQALCYLNLYFQGEPFLNRDLFKMISYAHKKGIFTATSTNGHYLDDQQARETVLSGLDKLIISVDGSDQETYEKYRIGGDLDKVLEGIKNVISWKHKLKKRTPLVLLQFIIFKSNQHQISEIKKIASEIRVDHLVFKTAQIYDYSSKIHLIPDNPSWSRYLIQPDGTYSINNKQADHCWRMWSSGVITWDGSIVPCCFDKDASHQMGQLGELNFNQIWNGEKYNRFRRQVLLARRELDICANCSEGSKVWA
jgi:radical SAM protein with 4Fe4S-binding SPASM domain